MFQFGSIHYAIQTLLFLIVCSFPCLYKNNVKKFIDISLMNVDCQAPAEISAANGQPSLSDEMLFVLFVKDLNYYVYII